jgi:hypothetical protein
MSMELTLPEVAAMPQHARFFKDGGRDFVEISFVGAKDTVVKKVQPEHMAKFRAEWNSYCDGQPMARRPGTPLTDIPGVDEQRAEAYLARNIHNAEELSVLSDAQCQGVGHGTLTQRESARKILAHRKYESQEKARKAVSDAAATIGPVPAETYASKSELTEVKQSIGELSASVSALVQMLSQQKAPAEPKRRGRPPKQEAN